ncbi:MAG TPA: polyketide synthase dehydratase domain-containing protein, partial [Pirellulales bacterium]
VGPAPVLLGMGRKCVPENFGVWLPTLRRGQDDWRVLLSSLGMLHVRGVPVDWQAFDRPYAPARLSLPTYPFQRQRHWMEAHEKRGDRARGGPLAWCGASAKHPLLGSRVPSAVAMTQFMSDVNLRRLPYLADHKVQGSVVFPGAGYVELALAAAVQTFGPGNHYVENVNFQQVLFLDEQPHPVQVVVAPEVGGRSAFQIFHLPGKGPQSTDDASAAWVLHAEGTIRRAQPTDPLPLACDKTIEQLQAESSELLDRAECRRRLSCRGLDYGPAFQWSESTWRSDGEALSRFLVPETVAQGLAEYQLHPALLDACIQTIGATVPGDWAPPGSGQTYLPVAVRRVRVLCSPQGPTWAHARVQLPTAVEQRELIEGDLELVDDEGRVLVELQGVKLRRVGRRVDQDAEPTIGDWLYVPRWQSLGPVNLEACPETHAHNGAKSSAEPPAKSHPALNGAAHGSRNGSTNGSSNGSANGHAHANGHGRMNGHASSPVPVWLLLVDSQGFGDRLAAALEKRGQPCLSVRPRDMAERCPV